MTIPLHQNCLERLSDLTETALAALRVNNRQYLDYSSARGFNALDAALPGSGATKQILEQIFGDDECLPEFSTDWISRRLKETQSYEHTASRELLSSLPEFGELRGVAQKLLGDFCALPIHYTLTVPLPDALTKTLGPFAISVNEGESSNPRLCKIDENFRAKYDDGNADKVPNPFSSGLLAALGGRNLQLPESGICLQLDVVGFIDQYGTSFTAENAMEQFRSFFGLGLAIFLFNIGAPKAFSGFGLAHRQIHVHRLDGEKIRFDTVFEADQDLSALINRVELLESEGLSEENRRRYVVWCLQQIDRVFNAGEKGERIRRAARWLFDSYQGSNRLLSFVQAMVALEILLGDKEASDLVGLTELLSNRCAYLLGPSQHERQEILDTFRAIYRVRSQIVHSGKGRLSAGEQKLFYELRSLCRRVLAKEIELLLSTPQARIAKVLAETTTNKG